jgi:hypothetical protein
MRCKFNSSANVVAFLRSTIKHALSTQFTTFYPAVDGGPQKVPQKEIGTQKSGGAKKTDRKELILLRPRTRESKSRERDKSR